MSVFGVACPIEKSLPCTFHILLRYPNDPVQGLLKNAMAGGDTAARAMILGMIYAMREG